MAGRRLHRRCVRNPARRVDGDSGWSEPIAAVDGDGRVVSCSIDPWRRRDAVCPAEYRDPSVASRREPTEPSGRTDVEWPYSEGFIYVRLAACRDISAISARYGLQGPALRLNSGPYDPIALAIGIDRSYHVPVRVGDEMREVERLAAHPADFDFVSLIGASTWVCVVTCPPSPTVVPAVGPRGTAFTLRFCCWPEGTAVEKIFTTPDGRLIRLRDTSREDGTVPAAWGSGPDDVVGTYVVKVHGEGVAEVLRFRIE